jgi:hypothetical protein
LKIAKVCVTFTATSHIKIARPFDTLFNVILPLLAGYFIYRAGNSEFIPLLIKDYFPDGLWAWSFISVILIIWDRQFHFSWILSCYFLAALFEFFQYLHFIPGTGDAADVIVYFVVFSAGLALNHYFKKRSPAKTT